jgi:ferrochelatase
VSVIGVVALNLGGPDSLDAVEPFLRNLFADPEVIQLGPLRFLQGWLARTIAKRRAPESRKAYALIGGRSPIREESTAQAEAVAARLTARGVPAKGYVAMACWHPFSDETVAAMRADGVTRAVALPLFPHFSRTTTGSTFKLLDRAIAGSGIELTRVERYPDAPGFIDAIVERVRDAIAQLPADQRDRAPVVFSAHGLPESYIRRGDPYLDDIRITYAAARDRLGLGDRAHLAFQSRVGPQKWLSPYTEQTIEELGRAGEKGIVLVPIAFTGEHIETLQELDILYKEVATKAGITSFARARTVGLHPAFIEALTDLVLAAVRGSGWVAAA